MARSGPIQESQQEDGPGAGHSGTVPWRANVMQGQRIEKKSCSTYEGMGEQNAKLDGGDDMASDITPKPQAEETEVGYKVSGGPALVVTEATGKEMPEELFAGGVAQEQVASSSLNDGQDENVMQGKMVEKVVSQRDNLVNLEGSGFLDATWEKKSLGTYKRMGEQDGKLDPEEDMTSNITPNPVAKETEVCFEGSERKALVGTEATEEGGAEGVAQDAQASCEEHVVKMRSAGVASEGCSRESDIGNTGEVKKEDTQGDQDHQAEMKLPPKRKHRARKHRGSAKRQQVAAEVKMETQGFLSTVTLWTTSLPHTNCLWSIVFLFFLLYGTSLSHGAPIGANNSAANDSFLRQMRCTEPNCAARVNAIDCRLKEGGFENRTPIYEGGRMERCGGTPKLEHACEHDGHAVVFLKKDGSTCYFEGSDDTLTTEVKEVPRTPFNQIKVPRTPFNQINNTKHPDSPPEVPRTPFNQINNTKHPDSPPVGFILGVIFGCIAPVAAIAGVLICFRKCIQNCCCSGGTVTSPPEYEMARVQAEAQHLTDQEGDVDNIVEMNRAIG